MHLFVKIHKHVKSSINASVVDMSINIDRLKEVFVINLADDTDAFVFHGDLLLPLRVST